MSEPKTFDHLLFGVGAMKAGTTWIFDALQRHPEVHFCREKEIHYLYARHVNPGILSDHARMQRARGYLQFDPDQSALKVLQKRVEWTARWLQGPVDDAWFNGLFLHRGSAQWVADFSNMGALVPEEGWAKIYARTRKLRVLYTLRDPLDRLWSHVKFHLKMQNATEKLDEWTLDELENHVRTGADYLAHNDYVTAIGNLRAALPPECLHIDVFDRIPREPRAFIADIERFLEISPHDLPDAIVERVVNPSPSRPMPEGFATRFTEEISAQKEGLRALGVAIPKTWA